MGDRGHVCIKSDRVYVKEFDKWIENDDISIGVYLYTHWGASEMIEDVKRALAKRWRWNDNEYLTRIILDEMIGNFHGHETGFGIGNRAHGDVWRIIYIDTDKKRVLILDGFEYDMILSPKPKEAIFDGTFEEFLDFRPEDNS